MPLPLPRGVGGGRLQQGGRGECRPSRQITQSGSRHSNSAKVELARSDHSNRELVSWKERRKEGRKEAKQRVHCTFKAGGMFGTPRLSLRHNYYHHDGHGRRSLFRSRLLFRSLPPLRSFTFLHLRGAHFFGPRRRRLLGRFKKKSRNFIRLRTK